MVGSSPARFLDLKGIQIDVIILQEWNEPKAYITANKCLKRRKAPHHICWYLYTVMDKAQVALASYSRS